jgi:hypothetical protein
MPALKRFFPNIRLGKDKKVDPCPPTVEEKPSLRRANARLHKRNKSSIIIQNGLAFVHGSLPIRDGMRFSRQNSFEPGQSVKDFDAISPVIGNLLPSDAAPKLKSVLVSRVDEPKPSSFASWADLSRPLHQDKAEGASDLGAVVGRYSLEVHPLNLATAAAKSALERRFLGKSKSSTDLRPTLRVVNADPEPDSDSAEDLFDSASKVAESKERSESRLLNIHYFRWDEFGDEEARGMKRASDATIAHSLSADGASPADSAIVISRRGSRKGYNGKGKGRQSNSRSSSRKVSAWLESQSHVTNEPHREIASYNESRPAATNEAIPGLPSPDYLYEQRVRIAEQSMSAGTVEFKRQQVEENLKLLADAWEIENVRFKEYLEHREKREKEAEVRAKLEEGRLKAEQLNKELEELLEEQVFQQALRDIKERERREEVERLADEEELVLQAVREIEEQERRAAEGRLAQERARLKECCVCGDSKNRDDFPIKSPAEGCDHPPNTCKECLQSWMASEFDTKGCDGIKCPECSQTLEYQEVQEAASKVTFEAYDKLATRNALGSLEEFAWCLGVGCGSGQLNIDNKDFMDCQNCGYKQCLKHKVPWHTNETCDQYEYRTSGQKKRDEEKKEEAMLNQLSKKCPGVNCGWRIEKIDGCEHMTCKKCKHEFCWQCLASHAEIKRVGNTAHATTCKFHSHNLDITWPFNMH